MHGTRPCNFVTCCLISVREAAERISKKILVENLLTGIPWKRFHKAERETEYVKNKSFYIRDKPNGQVLNSKPTSCLRYQCYNCLWKTMPPGLTFFQTRFGIIHANGWSRVIASQERVKVLLMLLSFLSQEIYNEVATYLIEKIRKPNELKSTLLLMNWN